MSATEVVMYSTNWCGYCQRARNLFERKGVAVRDIKLDDEPAQRPVMLQRTGGQCRKSLSVSCMSGVMMSSPPSTVPAN